MSMSQASTSQLRFATGARCEVPKVSDQSTWSPGCLSTRSTHPDTMSAVALSCKRKYRAALTNCGRAPTMVTIFIVVVFVPLGYCGSGPRAGAFGWSAWCCCCNICSTVNYLLGDPQNEAG